MSNNLTVNFHRFGCKILEPDGSVIVVVCSAVIVTASDVDGVYKKIKGMAT